MSFFVRVYRVPPFLLPIYVAAAERYGVPWQVLAAINEVETNYGQDVSVSSAGAEGWMQFLAPEWLAYGVDANAAGFRDPYNPGDAIFAAARYLAVAGAAHDLRGAIYAYNHSSQYVDSVLLRARLIAGTPRSLTSSLTAIVDGRPPVAGAGANAVKPIWVRRAPAKNSRSRIGGASVTAPPGAAVIAVQNAEVVDTGYAPYRGRFIQLRDVLGDTYTYAGLGSVNSTYTLPVRSVRLVPLRRGAWVRAGTVLGKVRGRVPDKSAQFRFAIQPAGAGRVDPRPILGAWQLLGKTLGSARPGAQPLFGPDARDALIGEIQLMSPLQLAQRLRSDPDARISACGRRAVAAGRIDRRVLAVTEFLVASGASPTISLPACGAGVALAPAAVAPRASGDAVDVSAIDGVSVRAHHAKGSLTDLVVRRLARLPAAMRPLRIVSPIGVPGTERGLVVAGPADHIRLAFAPAAQSADAGSDGAAAANALSLDPTFDAAQWRNLIARLSQLPEPSVPSVATSAAVPDLPGSPAAGAESPFSLQLAPLPAPSPTRSGPEAAPLGPGSSGSLFDAFAPLLGPTR